MREDRFAPVSFSVRLFGDVPWRQTLERAGDWLAWLLPTQLPVYQVVLVVNAVFFLLLVLIAGMEALVAPPLSVLADMGGLVLNRLPRGHYGSLITYGYLHFGILHLAFNALALSHVGPSLENEIGSSRFFTLYTLGLIGGGLARYAVSGAVPIVVVGASGGLFGLIGFGLTYAHATGGFAAIELRNFFARWALYGFLFGILVGADNIAHGGGFLVGASLGWVVERERARREEWTPLWGLAAVCCTLATLGGFLGVILRASS